MIKITLLLLFVHVSVAAQAEDEVSLKKKNEWDGLSVTIAPATQEAKSGDSLRFDVTYQFKRSYRAMNVFAMAHGHPSPTAELRFFNEDGTFFGIPKAHAFAGNFPNHEYLMYPNSAISFVTIVRTGASSGFEPGGISPGTYQVQLVTFNKISLAAWAQKDSPAKPVFYSNVVTCTITAK